MFEAGLWAGLVVMHLSPVVGYLAFRRLCSRGALRRIWLCRLLGFGVFLATFTAGMGICVVSQLMARFV